MSVAASGLALQRAAGFEPQLTRELLAKRVSLALRLPLFRAAATSEFPTFHP